MYTTTGKNPFVGVNNERVKRRPSQFDRAVHSKFREPRGRLCSNPILRQIFLRIYWAIRTIQFRIFFKNDELDVDDAAESESTLLPPPLTHIQATTGFSSAWIKYFYGRFKTECPSGRMREDDFRRIVCSVIESNQSTDPYISRLFAAFATAVDDKNQKIITFQGIMDTLAFLNRGTPEVHAEWACRLITGKSDIDDERNDFFRYTEFATFVSAVFALGDARIRSKGHGETARQRAATLFKELDTDCDGLATLTDLVRFFRAIHARDSCPV